MVGEVWIASGQSNMQWSVAQSKNAKTEIAAANYPDIRLFSVPRKVAQFPQDDIESGEWVECSPETVPGFSAVAYFFGREIYDKLDVPIGLIHSSWGGTVAETWISPETISEDPDFKSKLIELQQLNLENYREQKLAQIREIMGGELPDSEVDTVERTVLLSNDILVVVTGRTEVEGDEGIETLEEVAAALATGTTVYADVEGYISPQDNSRFIADEIEFEYQDDDEGENSDEDDDDNEEDDDDDDDDDDDSEN